MKYTYQCPKCGGQEIIRIAGEVGAYGSGNNIPTSTFSAITVTRYVCCGCGYSEEWIDKDQLPRLIASKKSVRL